MKGYWDIIVTGSIIGGVMSLLTSLVIACATDKPAPPPPPPPTVQPPPIVPPPIVPPPPAPPVETTIVLPPPVLPPPPPAPDTSTDTLRVISWEQVGPSPRDSCTFTGPLDDPCWRQRLDTLSLTWIFRTRDTLLLRRAR